MPDLTSSDGLAEALLARSETALVAVDAAGRVSIANEAARMMLGGGPLAGSALLAALGEVARLPAGSMASVAAWLGVGAARPLSLLLDDGRLFTLQGGPGPGGHTLLALKLEPRSTVPQDRRDPLTGLADRAWFLERLGAALATEAAKPAVLMIDLDRFKVVNDGQGRATGDALLQLVAKRLSGALRDADVICRFAGEEFSVLMRRPSDPEGVGRRIVTLLSRPYLIEGVTVSVGANVGIALGPEHGRDTASLMRAADVALSAAKQAPRNAARVFTADLDEVARRRHEVTEALRKAIPLRQLELHYQPQLALDGDTLTGFEAFLRWNHPDRGLLTAEQFISVADDSGLIWPITEWVLRTACEEANNWPSHLTVAVNVSARQLLDRLRLPRLIKSALLRTGLAPHRLEIEITESALGQDPETEAVLTAIDALGVRVSLDDFGTGAASLNHLRRLKLHKLKIDRSFIQGLGYSDEAANVVRAIAALGTSLGIITIAEGVETADQQNRARRDGCTAIQGHVLSEPVPASGVGKIIASLRSSARAEEQLA